MRRSAQSNSPPHIPREDRTRQLPPIQYSRQLPPTRYNRPPLHGWTSLKCHDELRIYSSTTPGGWLWNTTLAQSLRRYLQTRNLQAYYLCVPKSIVFPQSVNTAVLPNFYPNLQIVNFKPSRANLKFIYNHLVRANNANLSLWCPSLGGIWFLLTRRLADATYSQLIERIIRTN